jgi:myosin heavy subunit
LGEETPPPSLPFPCSTLLVDLTPTHPPILPPPQFIANISNGAKTAEAAGDIHAARKRSIGRRGSLGGAQNPFEVGGDNKKALIERQLLQSNPILEAFGNAKTMRNNNSSRFGKYLKIFFSGKGQIIGGSMSHYLLEKSRVFSQLPGERSYHFFYQLIRGANPKIKSTLRLQDPSSYLFLSQSQSHIIQDAYMGGPKSSDETDFGVVNAAMDVVGVPGAEKMEIFKIVAAVLNLGNVRFDEVEDANSTSGFRATEATSASRANLENAAHLLGLDAEALREASVQRIIESHGDRRVLVSDAKSANLAVQTLAATAYVKLFAHLVKMINAGIRNSVEKVLGLDPNFEKNPANLFVGILDIFGFEVFDQGNGFEQLLINYANERLHNFFIKHFFKMEEIKYEKEGIDYSAISFTDNQSVLDLIGKRPNGLFHQISNASLFGKLTDEKLLQNMSTKLKKKKDKDGNPTPAANFIFGGFRDRMLFTVRHSANDVTYTCQGFIEKNKDKLEVALDDLVSNKSSSQLVRSIFAPEAKAGGPSTAAAAASPGKKSKRGGTGRSTLAGANVMLSLRFANNISTLMKTMEATAPQFIRCVKSNECKKPFFFNAEKTFHQLQYLGVLDSIRIRHDGFSYQTSYREFFAHFCIVATDPELSPKVLSKPPGSVDWKTLGIRLAKVMWSWSKQMFSEQGAQLADLCQFGATKIFIRKQLSQSLEAVSSL